MRYFIDQRWRRQQRWQLSNQSNSDAIVTQVVGDVGNAVESGMVLQILLPILDCAPLFFLKCIPWAFSKFAAASAHMPSRQHRINLHGFSSKNLCRPQNRRCKQGRPQFRSTVLKSQQILLSSPCGLLPAFQHVHFSLIH